MSVAAVMRSIPRSVLLGALALMAMGSLVAFAIIDRAGAAPVGSGAVHACVSRYTGAMRHVIDPARCTAGEFPLTLASSAAIPDAPTYTVRTEQDEIPANVVNYSQVRRVDCEPGETAINGGSFLKQPNGVVTHISVFQNNTSGPIGSPPIAWATGIHLTNTNVLVSNEFIESWVVCVS